MSLAATTQLAETRTSSTRETLDKRSLMDTGLASGLHSNVRSSDKSLQNAYPGHPARASW
jgi:hypothetical protein